MTEISGTASVHGRDSSSTDVTITIPPAPEPCPPPLPPLEPPRGVRFWMVFLSTLLVDMLAALDLTAVSTALPTVVQHLHGRDFVWAGAAFTIASTAVLPLVGGLVASFGRKPVLVVFIVLFCVGSVLCGAATTMGMLFAGRALQGLGSGGSMSVTDIVVADMVSLAERGKFQGISAAVWALACAVGPPIGGALAGSGAWRWLFFLNLPICAVATGFICTFLPSRVPTGSLKDKIRQMDWIGNAVIIASTLLVLVAITWGGAKYSWTSAPVLVPFVVGIEGIVAFFALERTWLKGKTVPEQFFTDLTTLSGYLGTFFHGIVSLALIYYYPVYLQASKSNSPSRSGIDLLPLAFAIPLAAIFTGISVEVLARYRPQNYLGWALTAIGFGLLTLLKADSSRALALALQVPVGAGLGILWISTQFPVLAPIASADADATAYALAFWIFARTFAQGWGVVVAGALLQNALERDLPGAFLDSLGKGKGAGGEVAYAAIPFIPALAEPLRREVRVAFAEGARAVWVAMTGVACVGFLTCVMMREVPMDVGGSGAAPVEKKPPPPGDEESAVHSDLELESQVAEAAGEK
ncbi:iron permease [Epithele typhae]|uniref:iron permease n=1 Tax=Epithele typhae TaxID=378194 RepID=UPI002007EAC3|nr:iron permease [Epithele typhae]KAH9925600.1 iron permease [Epithele typhae]